MKRRRISKRRSMRLFTRTARKVHRKNIAIPMRGGFRI